MQYQNVQTKVASLVRFDWVTKLLIVMAAFLLLAIVSAHRAKADQLQDQIDAAQSQVNDSQAQYNDIKGKSDTLANHLALINAQIAANQAQLDLDNAKQQQITNQINQANIDLEKKKAVLHANVKLIYQSAQETPLEVLFSSGSLSQFVDQQEYEERIKNNVQQASKAIAALKKQLEDEQKQLNATIAQEQALQFGLAQQQQEAADLLSQTQGEESQYQAKLQNDKAQLSSLQAQQRALIDANSSGGSYGGTGGYPWANVEQDSGADPWGFYYRECTSYAAWKRSNIGRPIPPWGRMGEANAKDWIGWAQASGMTVDHNPEYGAIGVYTGGEFGHVMIVEAVVGSRVFVSQYNADFTGRYSESYWNTSSLSFIH